MAVGQLNDAVPKQFRVVGFYGAVNLRRARCGNAPGDLLADRVDAVGMQRNGRDFLGARPSREEYAGRGQKDGETVASSEWSHDEESFFIAINTEHETPAIQEL